VLRLEDVGGLDTLVGGGNLDQDAVLGDADLLVQLLENELAFGSTIATGVIFTYLDDVEGLVDGALGVEGQLGVDLGRDLAGDDFQDLLAELDQEAVQGGLDLIVDGATLLLAVGNGGVDESGILGLLGSSQDQGGVGGGILGLVLADGCGTLASTYRHSWRRDSRIHTGKVTYITRVSGVLDACTMMGGTYQSRRPRRCQWPSAAQERKTLCGWMLGRWMEEMG
jgi:hypothetical protein